MSSEAGSSLERDPRGDFPDRYNGAVLLADEIRYFSTSEDIPADQRLIDPFEPARLRAASYQLTLGNQVHVGGIHHLMLDTKPLILEPHQVAVVSTREVLRIPRFFVARWSIRVRKIYEGLLWTGGLQVDPGWVGHLFCPIYFRDLALGAVALIFVVLGVMVAALGVLAARPVVDPGAPWLSAWPMTSLLVSVVALGLSAFSLAFAFKIYSGLRR